MKILFKQKQWMVVQGIFLIIAVISALAIKLQVKEPVGGLAVGLHFIADTHAYVIPILFIILSDLAFNVEYAQGTFLTHLTCAQSRRAWMLKKSLNFYFFVLLQFFITFALVSLAAGIITGHFGLQGLKSIDETLYNIKTIELVRAIGLNILKTLMFVSLAVFVTTLIPGKLVVGSITSIGIIFIMMMVTQSLYQVYKNNKVVDFVIHNIWFENPTKFAWVYGILWLAILTSLSIECVKRVEIASRGA
jgi:hypothetical protein